MSTSIWPRISGVPWETMSVRSSGWASESQVVTTMPGIRGLLQGVGDASGVNRGDAEGIDAVGDGLVDDADLVGRGGAGGAEVINREAPVLGILLSAVVGGLEEGVARDLRDEGDGLAGDVAASGLTARSTGRSGGTGAATGADQARGPRRAAPAPATFGNRDESGSS